MKRSILFCLILLSLSPAVFAVQVGVSIAQMDDVFLSRLRGYIIEQGKTYPDMKIQFEDAQGAVDKQLSQVQNFINGKVDVIIVNPVDTQGTKNMTDAARAAKIPLIYLNRMPSDSKMGNGVSYIGSDEIEAGRLQMQYLADKVKDRKSVNVAIMKGLLSNDATRFRTQGAKEVIAKHPNMHVIVEDTAKWMREDGMNLMNNWILSGDKIDILSANADEMAIGAAMAIKSNGIKIGTDILVGGTDGGPNGLQAIKTGLLTVTVFQDAKSQAYGAVDMAEKAAKGESIQDIHFIPFQLVTPENYQKFMTN
ncbi:ribose transport system substrate-binding protein/inositol transport system substrate-binding protein [Gibbsiella quercinecans]|uniref:Rhizopine-binding protein n=2 Tax=Gibbsiella TaxID=929812 RepID=A0A250B2N1_9GAMM|nr:sugar ABC transporter substrate-binding protein [Gibbsiella quercinecans]ATA20439.1 rhizopine-binding protein [Gibbsiella quercinecans]RLM07447.1 rhizopine-binding protein [Gibbsiella quercinecans]TCT89425.1 ribose transport system substrate-binding protein/inositol transport system substrate-binding protein [Gibbsiella quercinecans]